MFFVFLSFFGVRVFFVFFFDCFSFATQFSNTSGLHDQFYGLNFYLPTAAFKSDQFWFYLQYTFIFFTLLQYIYPINLNVSSLVEEKAARIAEGMKMMGATKSAYWLSWILWFGFEQTLISLGIAFIGHWTAVFKWSDPFVIFFWIWGFSLSLSGFSTLISTRMCPVLNNDPDNISVVLILSNIWEISSEFFSKNQNRQNF